MSLFELFPKYPLILRTPPKARIRFGTHKICVDVPWQIYDFLSFIVEKSINENLTKEDVRDLWREFVKKYEDITTINNRVLATVSLRLSENKKYYARLDIRWDSFIEYLEKKAVRMLSGSTGRACVVKLYRKIWDNFFNVRKYIEPPDPTYSPYTLEKFKKLLRRTGDYYYIQNLLDQLEAILKK